MPPEESTFGLIPILQGFMWGFVQVTLAYLAGYCASFIAFRRTDFGKEDKVEAMCKKMRIIWPDRFVGESAIAGHKEIVGFDRDELKERWSDSAHAVDSAQRLVYRLDRVHMYLPRVGLAVIAGSLLGLLVGIAAAADLIEIPSLLWAPVLAISFTEFQFETALPQSRDYHYVSRYLGKLDKME